MSKESTNNQVRRSAPYLGENSLQPARPYLFREFNEGQRQMPPNMASPTIITPFLPPILLPSIPPILLPILLPSIPPNNHQIQTVVISAPLGAPMEVSPIIIVTSVPITEPRSFESIIAIENGIYDINSNTTVTTKTTCKTSTIVTIDPITTRTIINVTTTVTTETMST